MACLRELEFARHRAAEMGRALPFVAIVCFSAVAAAIAVAVSVPRVPLAQAYAALMLVALGVGAADA